MSNLIIAISVIAGAILSVLVDWLIKLWLPEKPEAKHRIAAFVAVFILVFVVAQSLTTPAVSQVPTASPTQTTAMISPTFMATPSPSPTLTPIVMPSDSPTVTITPTVTVFLSETPSPIPSATPIQYVPAMRPVELRSGVYMLLNKISVHDRYGRCYYTKSGFSVNFEITNESGSDFFIRFSPYDFSVEDDTGREYTLRASGVDECDPSPAPRIYTLPTGRHISVLVNFQEDFGPEASYLIVTVNEISNAGPFVFRKDL